MQATTDMTALAQVNGSLVPTLDVTAGSPRLLTRGGHLLWTEGNLRASRMWFDAAYRAAEMEDDGPAMAAAAIGLGGLWVHEHRHAATTALVQSRLRHSLYCITPNTPLALRVRARMAGEDDYRAGKSSDIIAVLQETERAADPVACAEARNLAHHCLLGPGHSGTRHRLAQDLMAVAVVTKRRSDLLLGMLWYGVDLLLDGNPHAQRTLTELRELLRDQDHLAVGYVLRAIDVMHTIRAGRLAEAEKQAGECAEHGHTAGDMDATGWYGAHLTAIRWFQGRIAELAPMLEELVDSPTLSVVDNSLLAALAVATAAGGDHMRAATVLARLGRDNGSRLPRSSTWLATLHGVVEAAHLIGDRPTSSAAYELLRPFAGLPVIASLGVACFGSVQHSLGVASLTLGNAEAAVDHFRMATRENLALGHLPAAVLSRTRLAEALELRARPGDAVEAADELKAATVHADGLKIPLPKRESRPVSTTVQAVPARSTVTCRRQGRFWTLELGGRRVRVEHCRGMGYLAVLFANPGREIASAELAAGPDGLGRAAVAGGAVESHQPVLDEAALKAYRSRLAQLRDELDAFDVVGDAEASARAHAESAWLMSELRAAAGLGGRVRGFNTTDERARIAVGKAIRRALDRIRAADQVLGQVLQDTVHTGLRCCYRP